MDLMGASELESSWPSTRIRRFHATCSSSCKRLAHVGQQQQRVRRAVLAKERLAQQPARGLGAEGVNGLIGGGEQVFEAEFARGVAKAARMRTAEQLRSGIVDELQHDFRDRRRRAARA